MGSGWKKETGRKGRGWGCVKRRVCKTSSLVVPPRPPPRFPFLIVMGSGGRAVRGHFIISRKKSLLTGGYFGGRKKTIK